MFCRMTVSPDSNRLQNQFLIRSWSQEHLVFVKALAVWVRRPCAKRYCDTSDASIRLVTASAAYARFIIMIKIRALEKHSSND